ncbi:MAG: DUF2783 domain-containing protein [Sedimentitalea sp.]|uniref:DUF2783 domain-containing protein n=1 Tax=Sedimentitalea sp. TaxID=2048915 RepID=UPI00326589F9
MSIAPDRLSPDQDDFYNTLIHAHDGLSAEQSHALNARLILLMANRIGDLDVLTDLITTAQSYSDD